MRRLMGLSPPHNIGSVATSAPIGCSTPIQPSSLSAIAERWVTAVCGGSVCLQVTISERSVCTVLVYHLASVAGSSRLLHLLASAADCNS